MGLIAKQNGESNIAPIPPDTYPAVCYGVIDLGTHHNETFNKSQRKICILWEIPSERIEIKRDNETLDLPRVIKKNYTLSLNEKSGLYKDLISWRGVPFTESELEGFDVFTVKGASCLLGIVHDQTSKGKTYAKISSVSKLMKGMEKLKPETPLVAYSIDDDGLENIPDSIPDWLKDEIKKSLEYQEHKNCQVHPDVDPDNPNNSDEIPF